MVVFPLASVTLIGVLVGVLGRSLKPPPHRRVALALALGVLGAWLGFLVGALLGVGIDVVVGTGIWVGIVGHLGAIVVALVFAMSQPRSWSAIGRRMRSR